jgi:thiamine-phosphate pyrophosphorylase
MLQVREKAAAAGDVARLVSLLRAALPPGSIIIVNATGRAAGFAGEVGADGAHLGGGDPAAVAAARRALGRAAVIGYSAHASAEIGEAARRGADYASLSPVFAPISKEGALPPLGLDALRDACRTAPIPVFALGGIDASNAAAVRAAGAWGAASIGAVLDAADPEAAVREMLAALA